MKAIYRKSVALLEQGRLSKGLACCEGAVEISPAIGEVRRRILKAINDQKRLEKHMVGSVFGGIGFLLGPRSFRAW